MNNTKSRSRKRERLLIFTGNNFINGKLVEGAGRAVFIAFVI